MFQKKNYKNLKKNRRKKPMTDAKEITITENNTAISSLNEPQYSIAQMVAQRESIATLMKKIMKKEDDYGKIPGCGSKNVLLKSGAEKICYHFGLAPTYDIRKTELQGGHREYEIVCTLTHRSTGQEIGQGLGSCSTMESKWRFRKAGRKCPVCNNEDTIIKGKEEFGGGWVCYKAKGGCNAKFKDGDKAIEDQKVGRVEHDNPADYYNTCLKMGKKRAYLDATLGATAASDLFTQDIEEMAENGVAPQVQPSVSSPDPKANKMPAADIKAYLAQMEKAQTAEEIKKIADEAIDKARLLKDGAAFTKIANAKNKCTDALIVANEDVPL
jgi:hypothetical protein